MNLYRFLFLLLFQSNYLEESEEDIRLRPYQLRITTTGLEAPGNENVWQKYFKTSSELGLEIATALHSHEHGSYGNTKNLF